MISHQSKPWWRKLTQVDQRALRFTGTFAGERFQAWNHCIRVASENFEEPSGNVRAGFSLLIQRPRPIFWRVDVHSQSKSRGGIPQRRWFGRLLFYPFQQNDRCIGAGVRDRPFHQIDDACDIYAVQDAVSVSMFRCLPGLCKQAIKSRFQCVSVKKPVSVSDEQPQGHDHQTETSLVRAEATRHSHWSRMLPRTR